MLYGESLGTGVATQMATEFKDVGAVVLESPYVSMADVAQEVMKMFPVRALVKDKYMTVDKISKVKAPILIMHGTEDELIPYEHGKVLYERATEPKYFQEFPGGKHYTLYDQGADHVVRSFLEQALK